MYPELTIIRPLVGRGAPLPGDEAAFPPTPPPDEGGIAGGVPTEGTPEANIPLLLLQLGG